jgi:hypothetical protein
MSDEVIHIPKRGRGRPPKYDNDHDRVMAHKTQINNWYHSIIRVKRHQWNNLVNEVEDLKRTLKTKEDVIQMFLSRLGGLQEVVAVAQT